MAVSNLACQISRKAFEWRKIQEELKNDIFLVNLANPCKSFLYISTFSRLQLVEKDTTWERFHPFPSFSSERTIQTITRGFRGADLHAPSQWVAGITASFPQIKQVEYPLCRFVICIERRMIVHMDGNRMPMLICKPGKYEAEGVPC